MRANHKVLVVDDDPVVGKSFDRVLSNKGYVVITAQNAREALTRLREGGYDAVFTDIRMPGMDGLELAERVKANTPWTPVVIVTGYGTAANEARARAAGVEGKHGGAAAEYNSTDYLWYGLVTLNRYDFTDTNRRESLFGTLGYTFEMLPYREQMLYGEVYGSRNTFDNAPYFNPKRDRSVGLVHRTNFIFESRFKRHVDSLFLTLSSYWQEDFDTHGKWGVRYEQDYNIDGVSHFNLGFAYDRNIYDGQREYETRLEIRYVKSF